MTAVALIDPESKSLVSCDPLMPWAKNAALTADAASIEESPAAEEQDHDKDDEKRVSVHALETSSSRRYRLSSCEHQGSSPIAVGRHSCRSDLNGLPRIPAQPARLVLTDSADSAYDDLLARRTQVKG